MRLAHTSLLLVALGVPAVAGAQDAPRRLAVLVTGSGDLPAETADSLTEVLIAALVARGGVQVVGKEEFQAQLGTDERASQECLDSPQCLGRAGVQLGVDEVIAGSVGPRRGGGFTMSLNRIEISTTETRGRVFEQIEGDEQALVAAIQRAAARLYEEPEQPGRLRVTSTPSGAEVYVDDERRGVTPMTLSDLEPGTHAVRVERHRHRPWSGNVEIRVGETAEVEAELEASGEPVTEGGASGLAIALTAVAGAVAIGGGVAGYLFGTASQEEPGAREVETQVDAQEAQRFHDGYYDDRETDALYANISFGVAGAAALFTTYMLVFESDSVFGSDEAQARVRAVPLAGGAAASAEVTF